ncbi:MAG: potassium transporter TrkG [Pseudomonadota bacterium]
MRGVVIYLAGLGLMLCALSLAAILLALIDADHDIALRLAVYVVLGAFLFGGTLVALSGRRVRMNEPSRLALIVVVWVALPLLAAMPIWDITDLSYSEAVFEATSGFATSGATVINSHEVIPRAVAFYRVLLQWFGGFLALATVLLVTAPLGVGGLTKGRGGFGSGGDVMVGRGDPNQVVGRTLVIYATLTLACAFLLFLSGHRLFHSVTFAMSAASTGGYLPFDRTPDEVLNGVGLLTVGLFLTLGATSFVWLQGLFRSSGKRATRRHQESYGVLIFVALLSALILLRLAFVPGQLPLELRDVAESLFNAASLVSTNGVESRAGIFALLPYALVVFIILVGGSAYSTSGGFKQYRIGAMFSQSRAELDRLVFPNAVQTSHFGRARVDLPIMKAVWSFFVVALLTLAISTLAVAAAGLPFEAAFMAAAANFATAGPVYDAGWGGAEAWPRYSEMGDAARLVLAVTMIAGRIEVLVILALGSARFWRSR